MNQKISRRQRSAPTISDVAASAGVSPMTVSRVINGEANVRAATRDLVNAAIQQLGYAPNRAARSLAGAEELRIGLLYSNPSAAYLSEFLVGGLDQASRGNLQLIVEQCEIDNQEVKAAEHLIRIGIDGVILPPPLCDSQPVIDVLQKAGIPMVVVASGRPPADISAVSIDDERAAFDMTCHLGRLGHRRIGFISGNPNQTASGRRLDGYKRGLESMGIAFDPALVAEGLFTYRSGLDAAERLLDLKEQPSAIFAANDDMAAAAVAVAHRHGLDVPSDITVCGFDDTALATTIWPELTTIHQPIRDMSQAAMDLLASEIRARRGPMRPAPKHILLDYTFVRRQSDAAPRRRPSARA
ncbi:MAG TPA: LacI family DNA-binding transcriptional regulator [Sphingomonas sp.]|uniref:LacI family DNA-binding transcriptional regulator n=1 Tax=Sphingomonas sp. TaxID=28214 RepID=UPI002BAC4C26|nr:LacI family DNA-binding transcriptional regulator [Sphingomonas sp.]HMI18342.1 LacI family DNA-binding transcriptional regulator [Sphingomonas sp.]